VHGLLSRSEDVGMPVVEGERLGSVVEQDPGVTATTPLPKLLATDWMSDTITPSASTTHR